jgi:hypothetical protein
LFNNAVGCKDCIAWFIDERLTMEYWQIETDGETTVFGGKPVPVPLSTKNSI